MVFANMSLPTEPTWHDMFNKMADNLLKVVFTYGIILATYSLMFVITIFVVIIVTIIIYKYKAKQVKKS
jgi:heme/copper-type cytochrome/quinol oxidase subunit 2